MKILLNGYAPPSPETGKVGAVLGPYLESIGHELVATEAEADAMEVRAQAYQEYNQAAILDKLVAGLPEVVRAFSEPLAKVDKITVVSTGGDGNGEGAGVNRVTMDMATMIAQVPAILESLTGVKITDLLTQVPQIKQAVDGAGGELAAVPPATNGQPTPESAKSQGD